MPPKQKVSISPGDRFGMLTVISESGRNKHGHLQYLVRCDCNKEYVVNRNFLFRYNPKCSECSKKLQQRRRNRKYSVWSIINNWILLSEKGKNSKGGIMYEAACLQCGNCSVITVGNAYSNKSFKCNNCPPQFYFTVKDGTASGVLPNGEHFLIDKEDMERVSRYYWHIDKTGYVISRSENKKALYLHNFIMGFEPQKKIHIDHINRNPLDCRKCNLRIVTAQQNSMNKSKQKNCTTGYTGVTFLKRKNAYNARIGLNDKRIHLGQNKDPVICAQMYNYAAVLIFREYAGELNNVPDAPEWIKKMIEKKCKPYLLESEIATQPCGIFYAQKKGLQL